MKKLIILSICLVFLGCSHDVSIKPAISPVAHQLVDHKVKGNVAVFIHPDLVDSCVLILTMRAETNGPCQPTKRRF